MPKGIYNIPKVVNEPVKGYASGSEERESLLAKYKEMYNSHVEVPMYIGSEQIHMPERKNITSPQDHQHVLGSFGYGDKSHVEKAVDSALAAKEKWSNLPWEHRAAIFLKAADLLAGPYRAKMNAATMLGQGKNMMQAEIDAACEFIDFLRFNVQFMTEIYSQQPISGEGVWNRLEYRPLEGFVFAITPFNFTAIAGNLPASAAMMGNVVVWKPSDTQVYSAQVIMELFREAGLPDGVINMITVDGPVAGDVIFNHRDFAGLHFTGSTGVFRHLWQTIGQNIAKYRTYPRIVGETGGKDFIVAHASAHPQQVVTAITRGSFEFSGQKCSASSRAYVPASMWDYVKENVIADVNSIKVGTPEDPTNYVNAVIDERSFDKIASYIDFAKNADDAEVIAGGGYDKSTGYFVEPTVIVTSNPKFKTICEEIFGPVVTIYVYKDEEFEATLDLVDSTSEYALTGSILSQDRYIIDFATKKLENAAGNFYINDKPTGAVVGQQPFGGARGSGTNDKAGSPLNLLRWVSPRTIKETFVTPTDYRYSYLDK
ncbi:MAG: 1-pyrroline-5-carboxylate dehydrogenase [Salibacteraceae bacterium]|jgi:1-pyrroline-5-carboxylate dehydrogenase